MDAHDDILPAAHSIIDAEALGHEVQRTYGLRDPFRCELLHRGMNDFYLVRAGGEQFVIQLWRVGQRTPDGVEYEVEFLEHLLKHQIPVPVPLRTKDGAPGMRVPSPEGSREVAMFRWVDGRVYSKNPTASIARRMGEIFGHIHRLSPSYKPKKDKPIDHVGPVRRTFPRLKALVAHRPDDLAFYGRVAEALPAAYEDVVKRGEVPNGAIHGDIHIHNAFITKDERITIMDFDACGRDHFAQELMSWRWSIEKNNLPVALWEEFLAGYETIRPLSAIEKKHIPLFLVAKEFQYLCGFSLAINAIGHVQFHFPGLDWFARSVRKHVADAKLL